MSEKKETGVAKQDVTKDYAMVLANDGPPLDELIAENMEGEFTQFDLERVSMPAGGSTRWQVVGEDMEPEEVEEITGIVLHHGLRRAFYLTSFDDSDGGPPDCASSDGKVGFGVREEGAEPSELQCLTCPKAQWGSMSGKDGDQRQACQQRRSIFLARPGSVMPTVLDLSPASLKPWREFTRRLTSRGKRLSSLVLSFGLQAGQTDSKARYSYIAPPKVVAELGDAQAARVRAVGQRLKSSFDSGNQTTLPSEPDGPGDQISDDEIAS